jgi:hypothetical protein
MSQKLQQGVGYTFNSDSRGQSLVIDTPGRRRAPLEVYSSAVSGSPAVKVFPGTVNGVMPQISGNYLDAATAPHLTVSSSGVVYVKVTRATGDVFPKTVVVEFAGSLPADTSTTGHITLATVTKTGNSLQIYQAVDRSLIVSRQAYGASGALFYWLNV